MKTLLKSTFTTMFLWSILTGLNACSKEDSENDFSEYRSIINVDADGTTTLMKTNLETAFSGNLSFNEAELDILLHMKEEEKLAMDVYNALYAKWGSQVFSNIAKAENTHMSAVISLLQNNGQEYTKVGEPGKFSIEEFNTLYNDLIAKGSVSAGEAFKVGALIEELDIYDLTESIEKITNENIILVFENLTKGSRNHLRAFNRQLVKLGLTYTPVYLSSDVFNQIVNSPNESGNQYQMNRKGGNGKRNGQR